MPKPKVLIVGCGAVGLSQGYHISSNADCTYLVRPGRKPAFDPPKHLYSYQDDELYEFSSYRVIESVSEVKSEKFAFIFDTLDGHTARSESGIATIRSVGDLLKEPQNANSFVVFDAVGLDIEEHYATTLGIARNRLLLASSLLAHQSTPQIPIPETANKALVSKANVLYSTPSPGAVLVVFNTQPSLTKKLEAFYDVNGKQGIRRAPGFLAPYSIPLIMLQLVTWNIDGFGPFEQFRANTELWDLMLRAQTEILTLPRFGWTGWLLSFVVGGWAAIQMHAPVEVNARPLDYPKFNAFHHGGKVAKQDRRMLEDVLSEGEKSGRKMPALKEIIKKASELS
ncbi:hypothetical protein GGP41_000429 [Bipolaris sorokiniana]|uniref:Ketopantoate reductase N-terminal domain-containing protein n=2 Tax=Cochliobolus sativus TaxID=45130 RepID=A0A8H5ZK51_COCSA|nr:uncharacterized protein COCSADRAFT_41639 [Bipolaris sorokiniana ND90Pr]EMD59093.1 hypothetical protein COCSADRAFT_41639 [Bipolaris sorokiniana ND90Pr]KAF5851711.1 hypothetical protein GGP41_000429 [Bipolaris sorokiniana]